MRLYVALSKDIFCERTTILEAYEKPSGQSQTDADQARARSSEQRQGPEPDAM